MHWMPHARGSTPESPAGSPMRIMVAAAFTAALLTAGLACTSGSSNHNSPYNPNGLQNPIVTGVSVGAAVAGRQYVHITGRNFAVGDKLFFDGKPAKGVEIVSKTRITAVIPSGAGTGKVTVRYKPKGSA